MFSFKMNTKILLVNLPSPELSLQRDESVTKCTFGFEPTLHDYHVVIIDSTTITSKDLYANYAQYLEGIKERSSSGKIKSKYEELVKTGGILFCFCGPSGSNHVGGYAGISYYLDSYSWLPIQLSIANEKGDTVRLTKEDSHLYQELTKLVEANDVSWTCHLSSLPPGARVLATNRAGYAIFVEVSLGSGKIVFLPRFKSRELVIKLIIEKIVPRLVSEEQPVRKPEWLSEFKFQFEGELRSKLSEIETAKRLLYTKDKDLKNAVALALQKVGFTVDVRPDGTLPDVGISAGEFRGKVEVKGHDKGLGTRDDVLQILGYLTEKDNAKGFLVVNHQLELHPGKRNLVGFTSGAIDLATKTGIGLISTIELWDTVGQIIEGELDELGREKVRNIIINGSGPVTIPVKEEHGAELTPKSSKQLSNPSA